MDAIGGYFGLELGHNPQVAPADIELLNSGRNALRYILLGLNDIKKVYVPFYTCEAVLEPIIDLGLEYEMYHVDKNLEIADTINPQCGEYVIINNYFGIKDEYVKTCCKDFCGHIIVDSSQALYTPAFDGAPTFWSPRKFIGVPDGGLCTPRYDVCVNNRDTSYDRCAHLLKRLDCGANSGYSDFQHNEDMLIGREMMRMSHLTHALLRSIDFSEIKNRRIENYNHIRRALNDSNNLPTPEAADIACPMVYPYLTDDPTLRHRLISNNIFVARYWPNVEKWCDRASIERHFSDYLVPLPIDQRYTAADIDKIISIVNDKI